MVESYLYLIFYYCKGTDSFLTASPDSGSPRNSFIVIMTRLSAFVWFNKLVQGVKVYSGKSLSSKIREN